MAAYPNFKQLIDGSERYPVDDLQLDRAVNGDVKARSFYPANKWGFKVRHVVTAAELLTWTTFYATNRRLVVTFTWQQDASVYDALLQAFTSRPIDKQRSYLDVQLLQQ